MQLTVFSRSLKYGVHTKYCSDLWELVFKTQSHYYQYSVGRRPSPTYNSRPLPDILYPPNGHCELIALKQFILENTQNIDHSCAFDSFALLV